MTRHDGSLVHKRTPPIEELTEHELRVFVCMKLCCGHCLASC